jgi:DNA-directed RNA polymerase specialized sigma24 family protein
MTTWQKLLRRSCFAQIGSWKQRDQVALLARAGFGQTDIAEMLGTTSKAVSVRLAEIRKGAKDKKK